MTKQTIRLVVPDWQAGVNPTYALGAKILGTIAPANKRQPLITVDVPMAPAKLTKENGVTGQSVVKATVAKTAAVIAEHQPDKIITFGGNCLVSQAPIDYLNGHYDHLGVVWVDAHPDISNPTIFENEHAMVVANLLHHGDPVVSSLVDHPLTARQFFFAGLQEPTPEEQQLLTAEGAGWRNHQELSLTSIKEWAIQNKIHQLFVHLDVDVLDPSSFYATYFNNPKLGKIPDNAARGTASLADTWRLVAELNSQFDLVGLTIAEYLPWSAQQLLELMNDLPIFGTKADG